MDKILFALWVLAMVACVSSCSIMLKDLPEPCPELHYAVNYRPCSTCDTTRAIVIGCEADKRRLISFEGTEMLVDSNHIYSIK